jgi:UDP-N-acetylmuramoylalanine--D-glutamate ligase
MEKTIVSKKLLASLELAPETAKVLIVGIGQTGLSAARFLKQMNIKFAMVDSRDNPPMNRELLLEMPDIAVFTGGFDDAAFAIATHILVSPGVSLEEQAIQKAIEKGVRLISDIDLFACSTTAPIVGITGSNGKSTVTTMLGKMAEADGKKVAVGGNLGTPALDLLAQDAELYVLELSSFQLERTEHLEVAAATVLNVTEDHFDRYPGVNEYAQAKQKIFNGQGVMVLNADDPIVIGMIEPEREVLTFGLENSADFHIGIEQEQHCLAENNKSLMSVKDLPLVGTHNIANALAAWALGRAMGLEDAAVLKALKGFQGLEHRMQSVAEINGVTWVNDSKATNVGACVAALKGVDKKVVLIAGGDAKGADMGDLAPIIKDKVKAVVLMGKDAKLIRKIIDKTVPIKIAASIQEAVEIASGIAGASDCVLLSPACASLDQFENYQERGRLFTEAVKGLAA